MLVHPIFESVSIDESPAEAPTNAKTKVQGPTPRTGLSQTRTRSQTSHFPPFRTAIVATMIELLRSAKFVKSCLLEVHASPSVQPSWLSGPDKPPAGLKLPKDVARYDMHRGGLAACPVRLIPGCWEDCGPVSFFRNLVCGIHGPTGER